MNRIDQIFLTKEKLLSIYFTAGYPNLNDTIPILKKLQEAGVDIIEIKSSDQRWQGNKGFKNIKLNK